MMVCPCQVSGYVGDCSSPVCLVRNLTARAEKAEAEVERLRVRLPVDGSHMPSIVDLLEDRVKALEAAAKVVVDEARDRREGGWTAASWDAMNALDAVLKGGAS